jgi:ribosome-binding factor A
LLPARAHHPCQQLPGKTAAEPQQITGMNSRRTLKAASAIREVVSSAILTELKDPRIENVTVTFVEISADMRNAKIHVSVMGDQKKQNLCMHGLESAVGFLQRRLRDRIDTRYTPKLKFVLDQGVKNSFKVAAILDEVLPDRHARHDSLTNQSDLEVAPDVESSDKASPSPEVDRDADDFLDLGGT